MPFIGDYLHHSFCGNESEWGKSSDERMIVYIA